MVFYHLIQIHKAVSQHFCKPLPGSGLSATHKADKVYAVR